MCWPQPSSVPEKLLVGVGPTATQFPPVSGPARFPVNLACVPVEGVEWILKGLL